MNDERATAVAGNIRVRETSATNLADAEAHMSLSYCSHRLEPAGHRGALDFRHAALTLDGCGFNVLQYGDEVSVASPGFEDFYMLEMPVTCGVDIQFGVETVRSEAGKALLLSPGPRFHSRWRPGTRQWMLHAFGIPTLT